MFQSIHSPDDHLFIDPTNLLSNFDRNINSKNGPIKIQFINDF